MTHLKLQAIGYIGQNARTRNWEGKQVIDFSVCHTKRIKNKETGEQKEFSTWINCSYWSESSKLVELLQKGCLIMVEGEPQARNFKDKSGEVKTNIELNVSNVVLLKGAENKETEKEQKEGANNENDDDLPF